MAGYPMKTGGERTLKKLAGNRLGILGFLCMLAGPALLLLKGFLIPVEIPLFAATVMRWTAIVLPGIGLVISIVYLCLWNRLGRPGRSLAIVTIVMCNPFFYFIYYFICLFFIQPRAGFSLM